MLNMKCKFILLGIVLGALVTAPALAGSKKLMTVNAAKAVAKRAIVESVIGLKVRSQENVQDLVAESVEIDAKTSAAVTGIEFVDVIYDSEKDIAQATAQIRVGRASNIVGNLVDYGDKVVQRVGFATSTPAMAEPLKALRAAEIDAYRNLAEQIVGLKVQGSTSVENYVLQSDEVKTKMMAAIYGAELASYHWDEEGDAYVTLRLKTRDVEDVMGQKLDYQGEVIEAEGAGAGTDDFEEARYGRTDSGGPASSQIREGSLAIPVFSPQPGEQQEGGGGAWTE